MENLTAEEALRRLFESEHPENEFENPYDINGALHVRPWWPPLGRVWASRGKPPADERPDRHEFWTAAYELLERLHADYQQARGD